MAQTLPAPQGGDVLRFLCATFLLPLGVVVAWMLLIARGPLPDGSLRYVFPTAALLMGLGAIWAIRRTGWSWRQLGFVRGTRSLWHLWWETPALLVASLLCTGLVRTAVDLDTSTDPDRGGSLALVANNPALLSLAIVGIIVLGPLLEEILFRRLLLDWLRAKLPTVVAVLIVAALFTVVHVVPAVMAYVGFLGLGITLLRVWHGSVWASLIPHMVNNAMASTFVLFALR